jgi:mono/diheme cytochrome c family protein
MPEKKTKWIPDQELREKHDPLENVRAVPYILILLIGAIAMWALNNIFSTPSGELTEYGDQRTVADLRPDVPVTGAAPKVDGKQIYAAKCVGCHQANGNGVAGVFPPLAGSEWVSGDEKILTHILLHGINGNIEVKGNQYNGAMPAWGMLSDDEIAGVLTYIRSDWGNTAPAVSAKTVQEQREATKNQAAPYAGGEALKAGSS